MDLHCLRVVLQILSCRVLTDRCLFMFVLHARRDCWRCRCTELTARLRTAEGTAAATHTSSLLKDEM